MTTLILMIGMNMMANPIPPGNRLVFETVDASKLILHISTYGSKVKVVFKDQAGAYLGSDLMKKGKRYKKTYDFSFLPEELYYIKLIDDKHTEVYTFKNGEINLVVTSENEDLLRKRGQLAALML